MRTTEENSSYPDQTARALVWDLPLRLFHWALASAFVVSWVTAEAGIEWADAHLYSGYTALALLTFRILWGFAGTRYARFRQFLSGPSTVFNALRALGNRSAPTQPGHSALGGWASVALMALMFSQAASGLFITDDILFSGPYHSAVSSSVADFLASFHHLNFNVLTTAVAAHLAVMLWYRQRKRHNLVLPMISGFSDVDPVLGITSSRLGHALICVAITAILMGLLINLAPEPEYFF